MIDRAFIKDVAIFEGLSDTQLDKIKDCCIENGFRQGDKLFSEGDAADHQWIVTEGQVDLRFDLPGRPTSVKNTISSVSAHEPFGWSSLVEPNKYALSAYCATRQCGIVTIDRKDLLRLFEQDAGMGYRVMTNLANIIGKRLDRLTRSGIEAPIATITIKVHMATCGIAAGAREVMSALMEEMNRIDRSDIHVESAGCIGDCSSHPNVTVAIEYQGEVVYKDMTPDKIRMVFASHVLKGEIQKEFVLSGA